jgi:rhodanese-related sulfurtransferase
MVKKKILFLPIVLLMILSACGNILSSEAGGDKVAVQGGEYTNISVTDLQSMFDNKDFLFINVHVPFAGNIPNTDLSIPFDQIQQNLDKLPEDKDAKIVIYCRSGSMSSVSATELVKLGYTNIWNLEDGFNAWEQAGLPLIGR